MELPDELQERSPAWTMGVMLAAMRERGWTFDQAWSSAIQRMRVVPDMDEEDARELTDWKFWLNWAKPRFEWAYDGHDGPPPALPDREQPPAVAFVRDQRSDAVGADLSVRISA